MNEPNFASMAAEDLLTWIENAQKVLDQKIAAEKAELEERRQKLARLEARRAGKDVKKTKPAAGKPRGRPAQTPAPKAEEPAQAA